MIHITKESVQQALKNKVITQREAHELLLTLARPEGKRVVRKKQAREGIQQR